MAAFCREYLIGSCLFRNIATNAIHAAKKETIFCKGILTYCPKRPLWAHVVNNDLFEGDRGELACHKQRLFYNPKWACREQGLCLRPRNGHGANNVYFDGPEIGMSRKTSMLYNTTPGLYKVLLKLLTLRALILLMLLQSIQRD